LGSKPASTIILGAQQHIPVSEDKLEETCLLVYNDTKVTVALWESGLEPNLGKT
jgi:hypothetical protein